MTPRASADDLVRGIESGDRALLARAITLAESARPEDACLAEEVLGRLMPRTGGAIRTGITGVPGAGKSTLIDSLGMQLLAQGKKVAVLAVDPSSSVSGGSILADKTRMPRLALEGNAFIRPSPGGRAGGGVTRRSREALLLCEAAGYDVVLVETVGAGQNEIAVARIVDCLVVLVLAGAGDELQGIKRGILELADVVAVNKADGENVAACGRAEAEYALALGCARARSSSWRPRVTRVSGLTGAGLPELWQLVEEHRAALEGSGELEEARRNQRRHWLWERVEESLQAAFRGHPGVQARLAQVEADVLEGTITPAQGARALLAAFGVDDNG